MYNLTIIKQNGGAFIDSREVAELIGKRHDHLLRDIDGYLRILDKSGAPNFGGTDFFLKSSYIDACGREKPCYLMTKKGCELCANKLIGEKGILFTAAYVTKYNELEAVERAAEIKAQNTPGLSEFNSAVKNVLDGMSYAGVLPSRVMGFLRGVYEPLGIEVLTGGDGYDYQTATEIARKLKIYSETGRPHGHAVSAIIADLNVPAGHMVIVPYGLVGVTARYDSFVSKAVWEWIINPSFGKKPKKSLR